MKTIKLGELTVPALAVGCRRFNKLSTGEAEALVKGAIELGANYFDNADIYGGCISEEVFGSVLKNESALRDKMFIQTKCGIRKALNAFDMSKDYILTSVEGSLKRLNTDYIDTLLIHRLDALYEPEEIAEAFDTLKQQGKVREFGVSNVTPMQIMLLQKYIRQKLVVNQMHFGLAHCSMVAQGICTNMDVDAAVDRDGFVLDFCRLNDITIQTWSTLQYGESAGIFIDSPLYPELNEVMQEIAEKYGVTKTTIAYAWVLRHPAGMQPIAGSLKLGRLADSVKATEITLTRDEWYKLFLAAGNKLPVNPQPGQALK